MATSPSTPQRSAGQPTQAQVNQTAQGLNDAARALQSREQQLADDQQAMQEQQLKAQEQRDAQRRDSIRAAAKQQEAINAARAGALQENDHAVIDLGRVNESQMTVFIKNEIRRLHQAGAHLLAGRVRKIDNTPNGRIAEVETSDGRSVHRVPEIAVVRADTFVGEQEQNGSHGQ